MRRQMLTQISKMAAEPVREGGNPESPERDTARLAGPPAYALPNGHLMGTGRSQGGRK